MVPSHTENFSTLGCLRWKEKLLKEKKWFSCTFISFWHDSTWSFIQKYYFLAKLPPIPPQDNPKLWKWWEGVRWHHKWRKNMINCASISIWPDINWFFLLKEHIFTKINPQNNPPRPSRLKQIIKSGDKWLGDFVNDTQIRSIVLQYRFELI